MSSASKSRPVRKAVIPLAGRATRHFPASRAVPKGLFPLVDTDGLTRPVAHIIARAALRAGIEQIALVVSPGQDEPFRRYFRPCADDEVPPRLGEQGLREAHELAQLAERITYITQPAPEGFGHAVWCARAFVGDEPFLLMLGDYVYCPLERGDPCPVGQILQAYAHHGGVSVTGAQMTSIDQLHLHGTLRGAFSPAQTGGDVRVFRIVDLVEKPDPQTARRRLVTPFLPADVFLTHCGLYVFEPVLFAALDALVRAERREGGEIQLTTAQEKLIHGNDNYYGWLLQGLALDVGTPRGLVNAQGSLGLSAGLLGGKA